MTEIDSVELIDTTENKPKIEQEAFYEASRRDFDCSGRTHDNDVQQQSPTK